MINKTKSLIALCSLTCVSMHAMNQNTDAKEAKAQTASVQPTRSNPLYHTARQYQAASEHKEQANATVQQPVPTAQNSSMKTNPIQEQIKKHVAWVLAKQSHHEKSALKTYIHSNNTADIILLLSSYFEEINPLINLLLQNGDYTYYKALIYVMQNRYKETKDTAFSAIATSLIRLGLRYATKHSNSELFNNITNDYFILAYPLFQNLVTNNKLETLNKAIKLGLDVLDHPTSMKWSVLECDKQCKTHSPLRLALEMNRIEIIELLLKNAPQQLTQTIAALIQEKNFVLRQSEIRLLKDTIKKLSDNKSQYLVMFETAEQEFENCSQSFKQTVQQWLTDKEKSVLLKQDLPEIITSIINIIKNIHCTSVAQLPRANQLTREMDILGNKAWNIGLSMYERLTGTYDPTFALPEATVPEDMLLPLATTSPQISQSLSPEAKTASPTPSLTISTASTTPLSANSISTPSPIIDSPKPIVVVTVSSAKTSLKRSKGYVGNKEIPSIEGIFKNALMQMLRMQSIGECKQ